MLQRHADVLPVEAELHHRAHDPRAGVDPLVDAGIDEQQLQRFLGAAKTFDS